MFYFKVFFLKFFSLFIWRLFKVLLSLERADAEISSLVQ